MAKESFEGCWDLVEEFNPKYPKDTRRKGRRTAKLEDRQRFINN
jgi:hypothetical protein